MFNAEVGFTGNANFCRVLQANHGLIDRSKFAQQDRFFQTHFIGELLMSFLLFEFDNNP